MTLSVKTAPPVLPPTDLERLREQTPDGIEAEKARLRRATKEFEGFFLYYMLKNMRKTIPKDPIAEGVAFSGSMGKDVFNDMFDMEIARRVASGKGRSIAAMLYSSLEKVIDAKYRQPETNTNQKQLKTPPSQPIELNQDRPDIPVEQNRFMDNSEQVKSLPISVRPRPVPQDSIRVRYGKYIDGAAATTGLDSALIASIIRVESGGNSHAVSPAGARGLMQLTDSTAHEMGVKDVHDPWDNILGGSRYLRKMLDRYGDLDLALAAYNAGPGNVDKYGGLPPFNETRDYVQRVTSLMGISSRSASDLDSKVRRE